MDSLPTGSMQSWVLVASASMSPMIILFLADPIGRLFRLGRRRGEQHGEDDPSEPGHGSQDHHVALLALLPRLVLLARDELGAELVQLAVRCFQLLIDQPDADGQRADMVARRLDHPGATDNGFCFRMRRTSGACQRRRRCALTNRSMVV